MQFNFLHRSPSQSNDNFEFFADNLELNLVVIASRNPSLILLIGYFNT